MSDHDLVIRPLIVIEHAHVNTTVIVIRPVDAHRAAGSGASKGSDQLHGIVHVHVRDHDQGSDHVNLGVDVIVISN